MNVLNVYDVYEYGGLVYLKTPTSPNTNKLIGVQRESPAVPRETKSPWQQASPGPAWTSVDFSKGALT